MMKDKDFVAGLKDGKPTQFDTNNDCFMDLESGRSDAIVVDETLARYYMKQQDNGVKYVVLDENCLLYTSNPLRLTIALISGR